MNNFISPSNNLYWQNHKHRFQLSLVKKNQNFKTLISFCWPNVVSHIISAICQKISPYFDKKILKLRFLSFCTWPVCKGNEGVKGLGNSILQLAFKI